MFVVDSTVFGNHWVKGKVLLWKGWKEMRKSRKEKEPTMFDSTHQSDGADEGLKKMTVCLLTFEERVGGGCSRILTLWRLTLNGRSVWSCFITVCGGSGVVGVKIGTDVNNGLG